MKKTDLNRVDENVWEVPQSYRGVGRGGPVNLKGGDLDRVLREGAARAVEMGHGESADIDHIESRGMLEAADPAAVSRQAKHRGGDQLGTIGSGNHFVEVDVVDEVFDEDEARPFGVTRNQIVIQIHTGSRGLGHQVATDSIRVMMRAMPQYGIHVADRELACAPLSSPEGRMYLTEMAAAANFAFANRQFITAAIRRAWRLHLGKDEKVDILYDVAHNVAKIETYDGRNLVVHRKGATRAFPGQPELKARLEKMGIVAEAGSTKGLVEEAPEAYKDVEAVVNVVAHAGIAAKVARLKPLAVIKG